MVVPWLFKCCNTVVNKVVPWLFKCCNKVVNKVVPWLFKCCNKVVNMVVPWLFKCCNKVVNKVVPWLFKCCNKVVNMVVPWLFKCCNKVVPRWSLECPKLQRGCYTGYNKVVYKDVTPLSTRYLQGCSNHVHKVVTRLYISYGKALCIC